MTASFTKYVLNFKQPSGTSRGVLTQKETYFILLEKNGKRVVGECGMLRGLSYDDRPDFEDTLHWTCNNIHHGKKYLINALTEYPAIQFGLEMAFKSLESKTSYILFPSEFTEGTESIPINGLIWMGSERFMKDQIKGKLQQGFDCIKLKIGALDFETELGLLKSIRREYSSKDIELRVDANGAFKPDDALEKLKRLSEYNLHSIEQPIKQGQIHEMARLCEQTSLPIALDEELIGVLSVTKKQELLQTIQPHYIIIKPSLLGGFEKSLEWISQAEKQNCGWWITSALESNIGLNAIAQWAFKLSTKMPQGLGTGGLFTNNFDSPLQVKNGTLRYNKSNSWNINIE